MVRRIFVALLLWLALAGPAFAADYKFSVDRNFSDIMIRQDGGVDIKYELAFTCSPGAHPIDIVDVGFPNNYYDLGSVRARLNGLPLSDIRKSSYIPVGVEVHLGEHQLMPGQHGTLEVTATNPHMVFPDSEDTNLASVEFYPTYYGSQYTSGTTQLRVSFHFPPGAHDQEVKWHYSEITEQSQDADGRLVYTWKMDQASPSTQYKFGVSFPKTLVNQVFEPVPQSAYTQTTGGKSGSGSPCLAPLFIIGMVAFFMVIGIIQGRRAKMKYFPPAAAVEGAEIKVGLTAPEAALLLEMPLNKVAAMLIFSLSKKGAVALLPSDHLVLKILDRNAPDLRDYEKSLLELIQMDGTIVKEDFEKYFVKMVNGVNAKMKGFNLAKTRAHYQAIMEQAWQQAQDSANSAELSKNIDQSFPWLMLDKNLDGRLKDSIGDRSVIMPVWFYSGYHSPAGAGAAPVRTGPVSGVEFANQVVSRIENVSNRAISKLESFTMGVTKATNPKALQTSGGHGGGGGCACACAGCACACAGGGR